MMKQVFMAGLALLFFMATDTGRAQTVSPLTTEWESGLIQKSGARPPASYRGAVSVDSDADRTLVGVWNREVNGSYYVAQFSTSRDQGRTWSEPQELLPNPEQAEPRSRGVYSIAAGENGVWMAALYRGESSPQTTFTCGLVISMDSGLTWSDFQDLTEEVQLEEKRFALDVAYCGNSTWIFLLTTEGSVRYIRSTDNGTTWEPLVLLSEADNFSGAVIGHPKSNAVMLTHEGNFAGTFVSRFSYDNGSTFGPIISASIGATDGAGNWVVSNRTNAPVAIPIMHSTDNGQTFAPIPSPPEIDGRDVNPYSVAYSNSGEIVLIAYAVTCVGIENLCFDYQSGLITRTSDLGQIWTPWERFGPNATNTVIPLDVTATPNNNFFAIMDSEPESPVPLLNSFRLDLEPFDRPAAARDWQVYQ